MLEKLQNELNNVSYFRNRYEMIAKAEIVVLTGWYNGRLTMCQIWHMVSLRFCSFAIELVQNSAESQQEWVLSV